MSVPDDRPTDTGPRAEGEPPVELLETWATTAAEHLEAVAGSIVVPLFGRDGEHCWTSPTQVHTEADERAGAELARRFADSFPGHGLVIEDRATLPADGPHRWAIDPVDGSANHLRGIPYCSLSAGLARGELPLLGVIHDLPRGHTLRAWRGGGAWAGDQPLQVSDTDQLADAMAIVHVARRGPLMGRPGALERLLWSVRKIRCMGSIALDLALLAAGEVDLVVAGRGRPQRELDILGGLVLVAEAGGVLRSADGGAFGPGSRTLVAGPEVLVEAFIERMADLDLEGWDGADASRPPGT